MASEIIQERLEEIEASREQAWIDGNGEEEAMLVQEAAQLRAQLK